MTPEVFLIYTACGTAGPLTLLVATLDGLFLNGASIARTARASALDGTRCESATKPLTRPRSAQAEYRWSGPRGVEPPTSRYRERL